MPSLGSDSQSPGDQEPFAAVDDDGDVEEKIRPRDLGHIARFLRPFVQPYRRTLVVIVGLLLVQTAFDASFPLATRYLIDEGLIERDWDALVFILSYLAVAAVAVMAVAIANDFIYSRMFGHV